MLETLDIQGRIDLAREAAFRLGGLEVDPSRLVVVRGEASVQIEPRVMAVLVTLAQADGRVVSRDELVDRCWDGRIVGDNALQRVISRLRHLSHELGSFEIETITKVGYMLRPAIEDLPPADAPPPGPDPLAPPQPEPVPADAPAIAEANRRGILLGVGAALLAGAAGLAGWRALRGDTGAASSAEQLVQRSRDLQLAAMPDGTQQSIAFLKRATELDPASADAWGALALAYRDRLDENGGEGPPADADWVRSAARRALEIDSRNLEAQLALATIQPNFRHWAENEKTLRSLAQGRSPHSALDEALGWLLCDTGRWNDSLLLFRRALAHEPFHPGNQLILAWGLWGSGNLAEADHLLARALELWPAFGALWRTRFDFLATTGRPLEAIALVEDEARLPPLPAMRIAPPYDLMRRFARAMADGEGPAQEALADEISARRGELGTYSTLTFLAALGRIDQALDLLEGYFFGDATRPPPGPLSRRKTSILFSTKGAPLRSSPRHADIIRRVGLDAYWRETGTRPDVVPAWQPGA